MVCLFLSELDLVLSNGLFFKSELDLVLSNGTDTYIQRISLPRYTEEEPWLLNINLNANNTGPYHSRHWQWRRLT